MLKMMLAAAALTLSTPPVTKDRASDDCLAGRRDALVAGHFSGAIVCSAEDATFTLVGTTSSGYAIYDYRYRFRAAEVMHGGQRLVIFRGSEYVGQYALSPPPFGSVSVRGSQVLIDDVAELAVLDFSQGPPSRTFGGGNELVLFP